MDEQAVLFYEYYYIKHYKMFNTKISLMVILYYGYKFNFIALLKPYKYKMFIIEVQSNNIHYSSPVHISHNQCPQFLFHTLPV